MEKVITIPGTAVSAMLTANVEAYNWIKEQIEKSWKKMRYGPSKPIKEKKFGKGIVVAQPYVKVTPCDLEGSLKLDPFGKLARFFTLTIFSGEPKDPTFEELTFQELMIEINRRIYGLINSLTPRELDVLQKRIIENKSITETASEMGIKPQGVVARMATVKKKVHEYLFAE